MEHLTTQHSLYLMSNDELKEFKTIYTRWKDVLPPLSVKIHNEEDTLAAVLNCWVILKRYPTFAIQATDKSLPYICNNYIYNLFHHSTDLAQIFKIWENDEDKIFLLSYHLAIYILRWIEFVLLNENEEIATAIFKVCNRRNYYVHKKHNLLPVSDEAIYIKQHLVVSLLTQDYNHTNRMNQIIEKSIHEANMVFQLNSNQLVPK